MKQTITLMPPPTAMQPGGYIAKAYGDRSAPGTQRAEIETGSVNGIWTVSLRWQAPHAVIDAGDNARQFIDGAALFVPTVKDSAWITMGSPEAPLEGALWRADQAALLHVRAEGLGTVHRSAAPPDWQAAASYANGAWQLVFTLPGFAALEKNRQLAFAVWQGAMSERAGLKSVSPGWIAV